MIVCRKLDHHTSRQVRCWEPAWCCSVYYGEIKNVLEMIAGGTKRRIRHKHTGGDYTSSWAYLLSALSCSCCGRFSHQGEGQILFVFVLLLLIFQEKLVIYLTIGPTATRWHHAAFHNTPMQRGHTHKHQG